MAQKDSHRRDQIILRPPPLANHGGTTWFRKLSTNCGDNRQSTISEHPNGCTGACLGIQGLPIMGDLDLLNCEHEGGGLEIAQLGVGMEYIGTGAFAFEF